MTERPNFVLFVTDQQRADWLGCYGHPVLRTPNIDALAARGTRFTDFHVAAPVCMPNRASLMTGRMPSVHGLRYNGCVLPLTHNTFVDVLAAGGYDTAAIGKSHLQPFTDIAPLHAGAGPGTELPRQIEEAWRRGSGGHGHEAPGSYDAAGRYRIPVPYYGFGHVDMVTGHGDTCGGHYRQWLREVVPDVEALLDRGNELPHNYSAPQAYRTPLPEELYPTRWIGDRAIDYLSDPARAKAPFFAFVSFPDPHHPFNPPGRYWDMYAPDQFEVRLPFEAHRNPPPPMRWLERAFRAGRGQLTPQTAMRVDDQGLREAMALTAGMIAMIDDEVGRVLAALEATGLAANTVVGFTSDHGDYLGDFGLLLKGLLPTTAVTRVPMIWAEPGAGGGRVSDALASTIDLPATVLERAGLAPYNGMQGRSFGAAIESGAAHRDAVLVEFNDSLPRLGFERPARVRSLRTADWRFTLYAGQPWGELYDLRTDPDETCNLWDSPAHAAVRAELSLRLAHELARQMDESPRSTRLA